MNFHEVQAIMQLEARGYKVIKRGWPDLIAYNDDELRLIEVKSSFKDKLKPSQQLVADLLKKFGNLTVELAKPPKYVRFS